MHRIMDTKLVHILNGTGNGFINYRTVREPTPDYRLREQTVENELAIYCFGGRDLISDA